ncbi:MAG: sugar-binding protein, partial [Actinobacteria bacterium]|nr:sugar-binding protein [Actinomycetota bacterium]
PWNITTGYDYNDNGQQTSRTITSAGGDMTRSMTWAYYPGGQLQSLSDHGVPTGAYSELADNSDFNNTSSSPPGSWSNSAAGSGYVGYNYATHGKGTTGDTFTWHLNIPKDGNYTVYAAYPSVSGAATSASFKVDYNGGSATVSVDQTKNTSPDSGGKTVWVSLGKYAFTQSGTSQQVTLTENSGGTVVADAVKAVRDNTGETNTAKHDFAYTYDPNASLTQIDDNSAGSPAVTKYAMTYDGLDRLTKVEEDNPSGSAVHTTTYGYDADSNLTSRTHDGAPSTYEYNSRNLQDKQTDKSSASDPTPQVTTFDYNPLGLRATQGKPNGNTVTYSYFADGLLQHQLETDPGGATVAEHAYTYTADGDKATDAQKLMNADDNSADLTHNLAYSYDPRDRLTQVRTDGTTTESYTHDATGNVVSQTVNGTQTAYNYDRDRLLTATAGGSTADYNYDPLGRLDTVTSGAAQLESNTYDGFDNIVTHTQANVSGGTDTTSYTYDPLNRQASQTVNGTTTNFAYLGLSGQLISETGGSVPKSYTYTPSGERLSQTSTSGGTTTTGYYTYNDHSDVEAVTGQSGTTTATYGYTAYGQPIASQFTGADKNNANPKPGTQPFNAYRFNAMRWDSSSGQYDMGFRDYNPGLNQFLSRDMYNGALADMNLTTDPFTGNRYTFGGGNPITNIELDGHMFPGGSGVVGSGGNNSPAPPPQVSNQKLQRVLNDIYARPGTRGPVYESGTVYDALRQELSTGNPVGGDTYHAQKAADLFKRLSDLLEANRKALLSGKTPLLSSTERRIAMSEAKNLWQALNQRDVTGRVTTAINSTSESRQNFEGAINNARNNYVMRDITGDTFEQTPKGGYERVNAPDQEPVAPSEPGEPGPGLVGGFLESLGILNIVVPILVNPRDPLMGACEVTPGCMKAATGPGGPLYKPPSV